MRLLGDTVEYVVCCSLKALTFRNINDVMHQMVGAIRYAKNERRRTTCRVEVPDVNDGPTVEMKFPEVGDHFRPSA